MVRFLQVLTAIVGLSLLVGCSPITAPQVPALNQTVLQATPIATSDPAIDFTNLEIEQWVSVNTDQSWHAEGTVAVPKNSSRDQYYNELRVRNADGNIEWTPVAEWNDFGLGYTTPQIVHWSTDYRYLYFTNAPHPDGCGLFVNASDLQRLDLTTGSVEEILPFGATWVLAAAPDGTMAHSVTNELWLLDPTTGNYGAIALDVSESNVQWGNFVWSSDSQQLAFTVAYEPCLPPAWSHSTLILDRRSLEVRTVLEKDARRLQIVAWKDEDELLLVDLDGEQHTVSLR